MRITRTLGLLAVALVCMLSITSIAFAAPKVVPFDKIDSGVIGSGEKSMMIVTGTLPKTATLPATVDIAVPKGAMMSWFGEIDDTKNNGDFEIKYTKRTEGELDIYTATLTKYKIVQAEVHTETAYVSSDGLAKFSYIPATDTNTLILGVEIPATAKYTPKANYTDLGKGMDGVVYGTTFTGVKAGQEVEAVFEFTNVSASPAGQAQTSQGGKSSGLIAVLIIVLVVAVGALIFVLAQSKIKSGPTSGAKPATPKQAATSPAKPSKGSTPAPVAVEPKKRVNPALVITIIIALVGMVAVLAAGNFSSKVTMVNGVYMKEFAQGDPCSNTQYNLTEKALKSIEDSAKTIIDVLDEGNLDIMKASIDPNSNTLVVEYCESKETPEEINAVLTPTGLVNQK